MIVFLTAAGAVVLAAWLHLLLFHGGFWRCDQRLGGDPAPPVWPAVTVVVPARDEAEVVADSLGALLAQDYPGPLSVILVDDGSTDGTADIARKTARTLGRADRLTVIQGAPLAPGWTGKLWAVHQGVIHAQRGAPRWLLLTDADIRHAPDNLRRLVARGEARGLVLVSLMVWLRCSAPVEKLLVPAFVYFFQKLYPFPWVNDPDDVMAAAAGGCMLVRNDALARAGGIAAIKGALIDDCALGRALKGVGPIWLGLTDATVSLRPYPALKDFWDMVARTAYTQLHYSPALLVGTVLGMLLLYVLPPVGLVAGALIGAAPAAVLAGAAWAAMIWSYLPTLRLYRRPAGAALLLPVAGLLYTAMTVDSAWRHWRGRGGRWKGRIQGGRQT